ncbi:TnsA-like heteromeric transposase endonuclease subunit [Streptomyces sp. NBC_01762]|uniref:TnsA-like heteromeric transposase endonuclease subunit n=1 Tax=Streptomyces sp. NBC_01762 TaxID=2975933 RepID=UPI002DDB6E9A|nr:TnsA-like heteromeric transposase endonuclease subunit [Streptomyces sp. NBC_01762]WSC42549.1 TnsA-like heteromeric transposase endonuclease subunit [Streptomyces sp. NBC_01762]WSC50304.1 TnsA-like heteromeric transposase endonuclease subunit [Streptomyces sp. NBC_01762]
MAVGTSRVDVRFRDPLGRAHQVPWLEAAQDVVFEEGPAVQAFPVRYGRRVAPGWWWSSAGGQLVAYGSGAMRTQLMLLDRDPAVVALACRPVELVWRESSGGVVAHAPQLMARLKNGSGLLVDCVGRSGPSARLAGRARVVTAAAEAVGWSYRLAEPPDAVLVANVRWLAGYRHPRHAAGSWMPALVAAFGSPRPAVEAVRELGDPIAVWPAVFHALWSGVLSVRLGEPLHERVIISVARQETEAA